jgi:hypothetical protein
VTSTVSEAAVNGAVREAGTAEYDLIDAFGSLAGLHAAMARIGTGTPCGVVARLAGRRISEVETAVSVASRRFPLLYRRLIWRGPRPVLAPSGCDAAVAARAPVLPLALPASPDGPLWRYQLIPERGDVWFAAIWPHAVADGGSMLRLVEAIGAALSGRSPACPPATAATPCSPRRSMIAWFPRFVIERTLPYLRPAAAEAGRPGVSWTMLPASESRSLLARGRAEASSFAAWFAAAACIAFVEQRQAGRRGRVSLDIPVARGGLESVGGFGFAAGSLLMPILVQPDSDLPTLARRIAARLRAMKESGWDQNLQRFLGRDARRHLRFAERERFFAPPLSVSWKGFRDCLGPPDGPRDVACFALSRGVHVSAHADPGGLSISIASPQPRATREQLLRMIIRRLGTALPQPVNCLAELITSSRARP